MSLKKFEDFIDDQKDVKEVTKEQVKSKIEEFITLNKKEKEKQRKKVVKPITEITEDMIEECIQGKLFKAISSDGCEWVLNPVTHRWVKMDSPAGKVIVLFCE